jgi:hypothetical protein
MYVNSKVYAVSLSTIKEEHEDITTMEVVCCVSRKKWIIDLKKEKDKRTVEIAHVFPFERGDTEVGCSVVSSSFLFL